jgi:hypothetical protein
MKGSTWLQNQQDFWGASDARLLLARAKRGRRAMETALFLQVAV